MNTNKKEVRISEPLQEIEVRLLECTKKPEKQKNRQQDKWAERKRKTESGQKKRWVP